MGEGVIGNGVRPCQFQVFPENRCFFYFHMISTDMFVMVASGPGKNDL
jgi:hypothetical protein